ncbi:PD-(D/E)XK motif protein [Oscillatoria sp. FACHB-1407]|uniref:PD-(D/E)XK motif protein n=1 Tax=Oscillatoria sp. FACHB-1407 TaxID=2692847 RepID=UPI001689056D|nr:PD-(D/E)XK motif protein [Oscillatoria sp. FACHB-1407]MBD2465605.1 PD-(D/E)XK motif protein [Oscillatoria sp. FACHB-1407]
MIVQDTWTLLQEDSVNVDSGYISRRFLPEVPYDVYLAIEKPSNTRLLMIRVNASSAGRSTAYPASSGFEVRRAVLQGDSPANITLQLVLINSRYSDIFTVLVQDIIDHLASINDERIAVTAFIERLQRWQIFLEKHNPEGLSEEAQQGLYGELWCLRQLVIPSFGVQGVRCWTGPHRDAQDFQFNNLAIEVKTTATKQPEKLAISNEHQLDNTSGKTLILLHLALDARHGEGETLPEMVESIRLIVDSELAFRKAFEALLFEAGYLNSHSARYEQSRYTERGRSYFKVEEGFPRIIGSNLQPGIAEVRYTIKISHCKQFSVSEFEFLSLLGGKNE